MGDYKKYNYLKIGEYRVPRAVYFLPLIQLTYFISIIFINVSLNKQNYD